MLFQRMGNNRLRWANWENYQPEAIYNSEVDDGIELEDNADMNNSELIDFEDNTLSEGTGNEDLDELIEIFGYAYDPEQDIFISRMHPWQRRFGYCRLFDELSSLMGMIIDCEPIYFNYNGKKWMIGIWKGQYDMVTGGEIGLYKGIFNINLPGISSGIYYRSANDDELLPMSFTLKKKGKVLFTREGTHWWLTGFKLGEFSKPSELSMDISIGFPDEIMRDAFIEGLLKAGYRNRDLEINENTVSFTFGKPRTTQPITRTRATDWIIQRKNKFLCDEYLRITGEQCTIQEKVRALEEQSPEIYEKLLTIGSSKPTKELWGIAIIITTLVLYLITQNIPELEEEED